LTALNFPLKRNSKQTGLARLVSYQQEVNIDIVINELDALVNIDLETRRPKKR
jgi:hypothetical protein